VRRRKGEDWFKFSLYDFWEMMIEPLPSQPSTHEGKHLASTVVVGTLAANGDVTSARIVTQRAGTWIEVGASEALGGPVPQV
jgi:hypothetical protein